MNDFHRALHAAELKQPLQKQQISALLNADDKKDIERLLETARKVRSNVFYNKIFLYGFVYFSTWCRNDCAFCYYRTSNNIDRYRKAPEEIVQLSKELADSGVHLIDLTMGEDLSYHTERFETVLSMVTKIKEATNLPIMISPGVLEDELIEKFSAVNTDWYALYQETHNKELFSNLRLNQDYDLRMDAKLYAKEKGMLIEEGLLTGVGETMDDIAHSIMEMGKIGAKQLRVMSFVPQKDIPMENISTPDRLLELKIIAVMRILYPWSLIPASLDIDGIAGLQDRLNAGANVVTSIIPPMSGLVGVAQNSMDVDEGGRTVEEVKKILSEMGLMAATADEYKEYIGKLI